MENKQCVQCGAEAKYRTGVSKTGNKYEGFFCTSNKDHVEWIPQPRPATRPPAPPIRKEPNWDEIRREKAEGLAKGAAFNKSVDVVIAAYNKGEVMFDDIPAFVEKVHGKFTEINLNGEA